jgi:hypothetical protein
MKSSPFVSLIIRSVLFTYLAMLGFNAQADQSNNNPAAIKNPNKDPQYPFCIFEGLTFNSAADVFSFNIEKTEDTAAGILRIRTLDCCIEGDKWTATLNGMRPNNKQSIATSDGNTIYFNGDAFLAPSNKAELQVSYNKGVDTFPAGMTVEICYSRNGAYGGDPLVVQPY